ncbi:MAG: glutamate racemase [Defluviitaleaceae bacterium]|nr:glutamate racemase [Defluviitaleaceae bacterium]
MDNRPIGVFDSGVGGLTVAKEIFAQLPNEEITYFGDTFRAPYGSRDLSEITVFTMQICEFLESQNVKALVIACNSIVAASYDEIVKNFKMPVIGVIEPACQEAAKYSKSAVGLMATAATVNSGAYERLFEKVGGKQAFHSIPCPSLVPIIEDGKMGSEEALNEVRKYANELLTHNIDTLILGCTHYPFLRPEVETVTEGKVYIIDPAQGTTRTLAQTLAMLNMERKETSPPEHKFFISGDRTKFDFVYKTLFSTTPDIMIHKLGE